MEARKYYTTGFEQGSAVRKIQPQWEEEEVRRPRRVEQPEAQPKVKIGQGIDLISALLLMCAIVATLFVCVNYLKVQSDVVQLNKSITGLEKPSSGSITLCGQNVTGASVRKRSDAGMSHIPEDRHKHGLVLDFTLEQNMVLQRFEEKRFQKAGFIRFDQVRSYAEELIEQYDVRSGQGPVTTVRSMSGGNQQKAIVAREIDRDEPLIIAVQPTRGLDVGAIEYIHGQLVKQRDAGKAVLLVSLELDEVMNLSDRILVMYEGEIVGEFDPKQITVEELGLYMAGAKRQEVAE